MRRARDNELRRQDLDYVVDGSVSCSRGVYRISVRLLDLKTDATPVWNSTFELPADRLDLIDEQVTAPIVAQIDPVILYIEGHPKKRDEDDDALSCVMRALPLLKRSTDLSSEMYDRDRSLALGDAQVALAGCLVDLDAFVARMHSRGAVVRHKRVPHLAP